MQPKTRLRWCVVIIVGSAFYGVLVVKHEDIADHLMIWYVAVLLTLFVLNETWKEKP